MVRGRKSRAQKATNIAPSNSEAPSSPASVSMKVAPAKLLVNTLLSADYPLDDDGCFNSPKRKETKIDGILIENGSGKVKGIKTKPFRPATRSTRKINEYFARLPANGLIRVQNGRQGSHSDDSCDSTDTATDDQNNNPSSAPENVPPINGVCPDSKQSKQQKMASPVLTEEAHTINTNLFLQEPVLKLEFDKSETPLTNGTSPIKTSFLSTEITNKFQTLPPTEYINKVLNVNGSHAHDHANHQYHQDDNNAPSLPSKDPHSYLLSSDSNSSDSGVVIDGDFHMKSPLQIAQRRRKPTTPHRILCPSPPKQPSPLLKSDAEKIKASRTKTKARVKLPLPTTESVVHQDHDYDGNNTKLAIEQEIPFKPPPAAPIISCSNKKVTEFFTVRRSVRKTKKEVQAERMRNIEQAIKEEREEGLAVHIFPNKGRGVVTTRPFQRGEFVIEYIGDLISMATANKREQLYAADDNTGCYMYYFKHNEQQYCIDATTETGKLGRLVNHSRNGNLMTKTVMVRGRPHLVLIAKEDLPSGVELTYDYGDRSKEALQHHPWLAL